MTQLIKTEQNNHSISQDDVKRLLASIDDIRHELIIKVLLNTGVRNTELRMITIQDIDFHNRSLSFISLKKRKGIKHTKPYDQMRRKDFVNYPTKTIPVSADLIKDIKQYLKVYRPSKYIFVNRAGQPLTIKGINDIVSKYAEKSGIQKTFNITQTEGQHIGRQTKQKLVTPHTLRHFCGTYLMYKTNDLQLVKEVLDHTTIKSTERYLHYSIDQKREKIDNVFGEL